MKKNLLFVLLNLLFITVINSENLTGNLNLLFTNKNNFIVGDVIKVIVVENARATQKNITDLSKDFKMGGGINLDNSINYSGGIKFNNNNYGKGEAAQSGIITTEISVIVTEVKQNGSLLVKGYKEIQMNGNTQKISIEGEINPIDIKADNTILSNKIANLKIDYTGEGVLGNKARAGILTQIFEWIGLF